MKRCYLNNMAMLTALGTETDAVVTALTYGQPNLTVTEHYSPGRLLPLGLYTGELPRIDLTEYKYQSRNNAFALACLEKLSGSISAAIERYGSDRVGVIIGTSTAGTGDSEDYFQQRNTSGEMPSGYDYGLQEMGATAAFVATILGVSGPVFGISTACSSGAKSLASARRLITAGVCDAVIAGGVDTLCHLTVQGFSALEAVSNTTCNPFSQNRNGINVGEGAALFLCTEEQSGVELAGVGESSDAHHISAPDPSGDGAVRCMTAGINDAGITAAHVDYINLHGTATLLNDQMEARAVSAVFESHGIASSTKPFTGHTLGAAGAVEAAICWLAITENFIPQHYWDGVYDNQLPPIVLAGKGLKQQNVTYALTNSFAFGGNNISLILRKIND